MATPANVGLFWFGWSPRLPPRCEKKSLRILYESSISLIKIYYFQGDVDRLYMVSWDFWKASDCFCWRPTFWVDVLFDVSFFASYLSLLLLANILYCATLVVVRWIPELESGFFLMVTALYNLTFLCFIISVYSLFASWIGMKVCFLKVSYDADQATIYI